MTDPVRIPLERAAQAEALRAVLARIDGCRSRAPRVLFDLDGTLIDNRPRSGAIFRALGERWLEHHPEHAARLAACDPTALRFRITDNLRRLGIADPERINEALEFWRANFFQDDYLHHDVAAPGALEFARACYDAGATLVYFTGRDLQNMAVGTLRSLRDQGFPIGVPGVELVLKRSPEENDFEYKRAMLQEVERGGEVMAGFDNEPLNCNMFQQAFPSAEVFLLDTGHVANAPELRSTIRVLADFRIEP